MISEQIEELAALHAVGLLDEAGQAVLFAAAELDPEVQRLIESYAEASSALACDAPQVAPPPAIRRELMRQLPAHPSAAPSRVLAFPQWIPYALAACLAAITVWQEALISQLSSRYHAARAEAMDLRQRNNMVEIRLASLEAKDAAYGTAKVMVAWDPKMNRGAISMENMPPPPPGHDYQLWVLDPSEPAPVSAGLLKMEPGSQTFTVHPVSTNEPGFAISLEPAGGRPSPTGAILFAVAPSG
jgi:anti-sigma-K factor RskA